MAEDIFLKIDGMEGESTDATHKDEINIVSYSWGVSLTVPPGSEIRGGKGRVAMEDFHFVMRTNKASPKLLLACATGAYSKNAILTVRRPGARAPEFLKWTFTDVMVVSYQTAGSDPLTDQVTLRFSKIEMEYRAMKADGTLDAPIKVGWDMAAGKLI